MVLPFRHPSIDYLSHITGENGNCRIGQMGRGIGRDGVVALKALFPCWRRPFAEKFVAMRRRANIILTAVLAVSALLTVEPAFGANREARERAARKACLTGDHAKGISILADLFLDTSDATYIFNQGRCLEQNRQYGDAIARFKEYLAVGESTLSRADKASAEKHIASCEANLAHERGSPVAPVTPQPLVPSLPPPVPVPEPTPTPEPSTPMVGKPEPQRSATRGGAGLRTAGIVTASVGLAALVAAVVLNVKANSMVSEMETRDNGYSPAKADDRGTYETLSWVGYGVGAACVATGGVLFGLGLRASRGASSSVAFVPAVGPGQAGVSLTGGF